MKFKQLRNIVLASASPRRKAYLERYGIEFTVKTGNIQETVNPHETPSDFVERMAREKSLSVRHFCDPVDVIISADTIVALQDTILGKPDKPSAVLPLLKTLNGQTHRVMTSYVIHDCQSERSLQTTISTDVVFNHLPISILKAYASSTEPLDKAGAYSIQGVGTILVKSIHGSYNNVVGLPIEKLLPDLIKHNYIAVQG